MAQQKELPFKFKSLLVKTDITAVCLWKNLILGSVGGFLNIYELGSNALLTRTEIFRDQKIYGIIHDNENNFILFGGKQIALLHVDKIIAEAKIVSKTTFSDWILDAKWIENGSKIATVFMHNYFSVWTTQFINETSVRCEERCILYSAAICFNLYKDIVVLSGTVFNEILLWKPYYKNEKSLSPVLNRLKQHEGVIFSIDFNEEEGLICSASDDRSAVLWKINDPSLFKNICLSSLDQLEITVKCKVYGHLSRVFRCLILSNTFATAGEDSFLIIWSFEGKLLRKVDLHQGGPIWSIDYNIEEDMICTGGNSCGVSLIKLNPLVSIQATALPSAATPKIIGNLLNGNLICLSDEADMYYYNQSLQKWEKVAKHLDLKAYSILNISPCKKIIALAGFKGQIYIYKNNNSTLVKLCSYTFKTQSRVFSFHWIDCKLFLVCQDEGLLNMCFFHKNTVYVIQKFILPPSKERWSTCACLYKGHIIVGDRKGNVYNFELGEANPINFIKSHSHLGVTYLTVKNNILESLGRNGLVKTYNLKDGNLECTGSNKTKYSWLAGLENGHLLSFSGENFIIADYEHNRTLYAISCGGGHRSWDYLINRKEIIMFSFIKQKIITITQINIDDLTPKDVIPGFHIREINSVRTLRLCDNYVLVSGGEDTVVRISSLKDNDLIVIKSLKVHLSSIRAICVYKIPDTFDEYLIFTGGGRGQIIGWYISAKENDLHLIINCHEKCNYYRPPLQEEAETRIMDLSVVNSNGQTILFCGCSDGCIKIFSISSDYINLRFEKSIFYKYNSITNICHVSIMENELLLSMATDGCVTLWNIGKFLNENYIIPINSFKIHQSGINSYSYKLLEQNTLLLLTGGDDNLVVLTLFYVNEANEVLSVEKISSFECHNIHCAQVTGSFLTENYFITSSIDQKIAVSSWSVIKGKISCKFIQNHDTIVADIQGFECFFKDAILNLIVYGRGIEHLLIDNFPEKS